MLNIETPPIDLGEAWAKIRFGMGDFFVAFFFGISFLLPLIFMPLTAL
jgi:hypothetical protein